MEIIFTEKYENCIWGNDNNKIYKGSSGCGSELNYIINYCNVIKNYIIDNNIKSVVDLGCGSFLNGKTIYEELDICYTGYDIYTNLIEYLTKNKEYSPTKYTFKKLDIYNQKEDIINGDLCILKDVLQHWDNNTIYSFLDYLTYNKKFKHIIICNDCKQTKESANTSIGGWRELNCNYLPIKKYNPIELGIFKRKQISVIKI